MKVCDKCNKKKKNAEFGKDNRDELLDTCKVCENERVLDKDEQEGWNDLIEYYND